MNLTNGRWLNGFDTATVARDMEGIGPMGVVRGLVRQGRFHPSGPPRDEYNVAAHSGLVARIFLRARTHFDWPMDWLVYALIHDDHEFVLGDVTSPVKRHLKPAISDLEEAVDEGLRIYYGIGGQGRGHGDDAKAAVKLCDLAALYIEAAEWGLCLEERPDELSENLRTILGLCGMSGEKYAEAAWPVRRCNPVVIPITPVVPRGQCPNWSPDDPCNKNDGCCHGTGGPLP